MVKMMGFKKTLIVGLKFILVGLFVAIVAWLLKLLYAFVIVLTNNIWVLLIGAIVLLVLIIYVYGVIAQKIFKIIR